MYGMRRRKEGDDGITDTIQLIRCRRARVHHPQDVMVLALWCTSNPANRTELAFRAELSTNGSERLELAKV